MNRNGMMNGHANEIDDTHSEKAEEVCQREENTERALFL